MKDMGLILSVTALVLLSACGKSHRGPEITLADLETTNAPVSTNMTRFNAKPGSKISVDGTANMIHTRWLVESPAIGGYLEVGPSFPIEPGQAVKAGKVAAKAEVFTAVRSLRSMDNGKPYSDKMDDIMYEKLRATNDPKARITYSLKELVLKQPASTNGAPYVFDSKGELVVGGVTNSISMPVSVLPLGDKKLKISGSVAVKMSDFKIGPPTVNLVVGKLKTGDEVKLSFDWLVGQTAPAAEPASPTASASAK